MLYMIGGSLHKVVGGYVHLLYNSNPGEYDVAVLVVCTDCDIAVVCDVFVLIFSGN
jgi:hypothetical protein